MIYKWLISLVSGILAALFLASAALAGGGGFSVVYHPAPAWIVVNQPTVIRFHVDSACTDLPESGLTPQLTATNLSTGRELRVLANPGNMDGDYQATVAFPTDGQWSWRLAGDGYLKQTDQLVNVVSSEVSMTKITSLWPLLRALIELRVVAPLDLVFTP